MEVKITTGKKPHLLKIASERQLDQKGLEVLYLHHDALAVRDGAGQTLPELIAKIRSTVSVEPAALTRFDDALLTAGYFEIHQQRYGERGYAVRETNDFFVGKKFPRITEEDLVEGVGSVTYLLSVAACRSHAVDAKSIALAIGSAVKSRSTKS